MSSASIQEIRYPHRQWRDHDRRRGRQRRDHLIRKPVSLWQHVRMIGEDVIQGDVLLPTNYRIRVFDIGVLISAGIREVWVRKKPKVLHHPYRAGTD